MSCILVILLRLRQAAVHMALIKKELDLEAFREEGIASTENDALKHDFQQVNSIFQRLSISSNAEHSGDELERLFTRGYKTAKIRAVLERLDGVINVNEKCVIVSQWTSVLEILELQLKEKGIDYTSITGKVSTKDRNHLFLVDLHWNPALESQVCDRIYRISQTKDVFIHKFVTEDSMETRVLSIQERKKKLAESILGGEKSGKLTRADIEFLFDIESS